MTTSNDPQSYGQTAVIVSLVTVISINIIQPFLRERGTQKQLENATRERDELRVANVSLQARNDALIASHGRVVDTNNIVVRELERLLIAILVSHGEQKPGFPVLNLTPAGDREILSEHYQLGRPLGPKVLIIEDDRVTRLALSTIFTNSNFLVHENNTVSDGIQSLEEFSPDYVVLDLVFTFGRGQDVVEHIVHNSIPCKIVVMSSTPPEQIATAIHEAAFAIFEKPGDIREVVELIRSGHVKPENLPRFAKRNLESES